jgi:hypothetical protein
MRAKIQHIEPLIISIKVLLLGAHEVNLLESLYDSIGKTTALVFPN